MIQINNQGLFNTINSFYFVGSTTFIGQGKRMYKISLVFLSMGELGILLSRFIDLQRLRQKEAFSARLKCQRCVSRAGGTRGARGSIDSPTPPYVCHFVNLTFLCYYTNPPPPIHFFTFRNAWCFQNSKIIISITFKSLKIMLPKF